jgi:hypothetical protein
MNVIDSVTKHAHFIPTHTTIPAEGAARLYLREVWKHHGMPRVVLLDRGSQFTAGFMRELYKFPGIKLATSTAYHPQTNGQTEHVRGHPSVSLLPLSSPTLHLFICNPPHRLCTIFKDHTHSQRLSGPMVRRLPRSRLTDSRRLPASPPARTSTASDELRTHWDESA